MASPTEDSGQFGIGTFDNASFSMPRRAGDFGRYFTFQDKVDEATQKCIHDPDVCQVNKIRESKSWKIENLSVGVI